jgi:DNA-binding CsgD family transcriptional regulator/DNA polymerase III delta prime subunit
VAGAGAAPPDGIVGREPEIELLRAFVAGEGDRRAAILAGPPGIGKTTLWEAAVEAAVGAGRRVLTARPSDAEARLAFAALIDLLDDVERAELDAVPAPQVEALEVALLRASPSGTPPEANAVAVGFRNALRSVARERPVVVAIDDVQWLDPPSAAALTFAARRLDDTEGVRFLLAKRAGTASVVEQALGADGVERVDVGPLNLEGVRRVLVGRFGFVPSRPLLRRIFDVTLGNPLFVLEVARTLGERGEPAIGEVLPVPDGVEELLGTRVAALPPAVRRLLLAIALSPDLRVAQLAELGGSEALDAAVEDRVLVVDGERVRAWHPLLTAAVVHDADAAEQRDLHRAVSAVVGEGELRTRHLVLAAEQPDAALAARASQAALDASIRGATETAVELADHGLRLTPPGDERRQERVLGLAGYLVVAGERGRVTELLAPEVDSLPPGPARVRANLLLAGGAVTGNTEIQGYLERALAESGGDRRLRALVLLEQASNAAVIRVEGIPEADALAVEALPSARAEGHAAERAALYVLGWTRSLAGRPIDDLCDRFREASDDAFYIAKSPERIAAQRLVWRGSLREARAELVRLLAVADERGEPSSYALQRLHLCELELRAGEWEAAERLLAEWEESRDRELLVWPMYERCRALLAAGRGLPQEARRWSVEAVARADTTGVRWDRLEALRAGAVAELLARAPERAAEHLRAVWLHTEREGVDDPGAFPVAADLVEALVELDAHDEAARVTDRLRRLAEGQLHPWGRAAGLGCSGLLRVSVDADDGGAYELRRAADELEALGLRFDAARVLLGGGRALRRARKWGAARELLERAAAAFDRLESTGWAAEAHSELGRLGARRPRAAGELTPTERRVAELAAQGLRNKEIAQTLVVTVNTVEFHLRNAYAKLGIRSRAQLAARLATGAQGEAPGS